MALNDWQIVKMEAMASQFLHKEESSCAMTCRYSLLYTYRVRHCFERMRTHAEEIGEHSEIGAHSEIGEIAEIAEIGEHSEDS